VPGPAIGVGAWVGSLGDGLVHAAAVGGWRCLIDGGADQWVAERDPGGNGKQPVCLRRAGGVRADAKVPGSAPQQRRIACRLGRGQQQQALGHLRKRRDPPLEALLDPAGQRRRARHSEPAGQFRSSYPAGQLKQSQRIAAGLSDNAVTDAVIQPSGDDRGQQGPGISIAQALQRQLGKPSGAGHRALIAGAEKHGDRFRVQPPGHERQDLGRGLVQPLRIVDQAQQRLLRGHLRQQAQHSQANQETIRCAGRTQAERDAESVALRPGQGAAAVQHPAAELVQRREGQLHLRLDTLSACHEEVRCRVGCVAEQRGLADASLTADDQRPAAAGPYLRQQLVEGHALPGAGAKHHHHPLWGLPHTVERIPLPEQSQSLG
jgi:hypothetical protein